MNHISYIALGGNLGEVCSTFKEALALMEAYGHQILAVSQNYRSVPWGNPDQPDFFNAVAKISHNCEPEILLDQLLFIERQLGRPAKHALNGPRPIDLDYLLCDQLVIRSKSLIIPHPRMTERPFVMIPLAAIAPDLTIPGYEGTAKILAEKLANLAGEAGSLIDSRN